MSFWVCLLFFFHSPKKLPKTAGGNPKPADLKTPNRSFLISEIFWLQELHLELWWFVGIRRGPIPAEGLITGWRLFVSLKGKRCSCFFSSKKKHDFSFLLGKKWPLGDQKVKLGVDSKMKMLFIFGGEVEEFEGTFSPNSFAAWDTLTSEWFSLSWTFCCWVLGQILESVKSFEFEAKVV